MSETEMGEEFRRRFEAWKHLFGEGDKDVEQKAELGIDGNCAFALLGPNLQEGEAEFVELEPNGSNTYKPLRERERKTMKLEIDLSEILRDEYGEHTETLAESVKRQVTEKLTAEVSKGIRAQINEEVSRVLTEELQAAVKERMPALLDDLLNAEYRPVDTWGNREKEPTTLRKELVKAITAQMVYNAKARYDSEKNLFTKTVDEAVAEQVRIMKKDFDGKIIELFQKEAFNYAMTKMGEKLGVKVAPTELKS